jgi:hypothetical protein
MKKLNPLAVGLSVGIVMGAGLFLLGLGAWLFNLGTDIVKVVSSLYKGYSPTPLGSLIGGIWAFIDWFIGGVIFAWIYNRFVE